VTELSDAHWKRFGRSYYQRHDFEGLPIDRAMEVMSAARKSLPALEGRSFGTGKADRADDFEYHDPVSKETVPGQGLRILLKAGSRAVARLSGTDTSAATLRVYLERYETRDLFEDVSRMLEPLARAACEWLDLERRCGVSKPTLIT
jgi:phosphoglucomutase